MVLYGYKADGTPLKSQWQTILYHLQSNPGTTITSWQAIKEFGFTRLSAVVFDIEKHTGIALRRRDVKIQTRYGGTCWVTEYWYQQDDESKQNQ